MSMYSLDKIVSGRLGPTKVIYFFAILFPLTYGAFQSTAAKADFLDVLFGRDDNSAGKTGNGVDSDTTVQDANRSQDRAGADLANALSHKRKGARDRPVGKPGVSGAKTVKANLCPFSSAETEKSDVMLLDKSLRRGDAIVTEKGIVIFDGGIGCPHKESDFVSLNSAKIPVATREKLGIIEQGLRSPKWREAALWSQNP
jgi:hypothetical protein